MVRKGSDPEGDHRAEEWERCKQFEQQLKPFLAQAEKEAAKEIGPPPEPPSLEDFGLQETHVSRPRFSDRCGIILVVAWGAGVVYFAWTGFITGGIGGGVMTALVSAWWLFLGVLLCVGLLRGVVDPVDQLLWKNFSPAWPLYQRYITAQTGHSKALLEYGFRKRDIARAKASHQLEIAKRYEDHWRNLSGVDFEHALGALFRRMGYSVENTPYTGDQGVDLLLRKDGKLTVVQCKAHSTKISISTARELYASMMDFKADEAIIACFEGVTRPVGEYIRARSIKAITLTEIVELQRRYGEVIDSLGHRLASSKLPPALTRKSEPPALTKKLEPPALTREYVHWLVKEHVTFEESKKLGQLDPQALFAMTGEDRMALLTALFDKQRATVINSRLESAVKP